MLSLESTRTPAGAALIEQGQAAAVLMALTLLGGTGGITRPIDVVTTTPYVRRAVDQVELSPADVVADVRSAFGLSTVQLSAVLHVSRQTVYDWIAQRQRPQAENRERLSALRGLAMLWQKEGVNETTRQRFDDKVALVELLKKPNLRDQTVRDGIKRLAQMRRQAQKRPSVVDTMQKYGFTTPSIEQQEASIDRW